MKKPFHRIIAVIFLILGGCGGGSSGSDTNNNVGQQETPATTDTISTNTIQTKVTAVCMNCHAGIQEPNMSTSGLLKANANRAFREASTRQMPPDDSGFPKLSNCQIAIFEEWVERGTPDSSTETVGTLPECS